MYVVGSSALGCGVNGKRTRSTAMPHALELGLLGVSSDTDLEKHVAPIYVTTRLSYHCQ